MQALLGRTSKNWTWVSFCFQESSPLSFGKSPLSTTELPRWVKLLSVRSQDRQDPRATFLFCILDTYGLSLSGEILASGPVGVLSTVNVPGQVAALLWPGFRNQTCWTNGQMLSDGIRAQRDCAARYSAWCSRRSSGNSSGRPVAGQALVWAPRIQQWKKKDGPRLWGSEMSQYVGVSEVPPRAIAVVLGRESCHSWTNTGHVGLQLYSWISFHFCLFFTWTNRKS